MFVICLLFVFPFSLKQGGDKLTLSLSGIKSAFPNNAMESLIGSIELDSKVTNELKNDGNAIPVTVTHFSDQRGKIERVVLPSTDHIQNQPNLSVTSFLNTSNDLKTVKSNCDEITNSGFSSKSNETDNCTNVDSETIVNSNNPFVNPFNNTRVSQRNDSQTQQSLSTTNPFHSDNSNPFSGNNPFRNMDQAELGDVVTTPNNDITSPTLIEEDTIRKTSTKKVFKIMIWLRG